MPKHTFILNGEPVTVDVDGRRAPAVGAPRPARRHRPEVRLRHRRLQGLHLPHQRQGVQPLLGARVATSSPTDEITTIEGLAATVGDDLHPMQEAWLEHDVAQCGYCQPGQIMAAVALVKQAASRGPRRSPTPTSTRSATSAAAAPTPASARRHQGRRQAHVTDG